MSLALLFQQNLAGAVADTTAPVVSSVTVQSDGTVAIALTEIVYAGAGGNAGFSLSAPAGSVSLAYSSGVGTSVLIYNASRAISTTETGITCSYVQPGNGIEDAAGNDLASFASVAVTNNSSQNRVPSDILLSNTVIYTSSGANASVGTLSATDQDYAETFSYELWDGVGADNNASFNILGDTLRCNDPSVLGAGAYSIRIRVTDSAGNTAEEVFSITIAEQTVTSSINRHVKRFYARPNRITPLSIISLSDGDAKAVSVDWSAKAAHEDTEVESVTWSITGNVGVSNQELLGSVAFALISADNASDSVVYAKATFVDGQKDTIKIHVRVN